MGLGLMAAEIARDLEKQVERERSYEKSMDYQIYNREYEEMLERQRIEYKKMMIEENKYRNSIIKAEEQFNSMMQKLSKELNKNIHMLETHKPVINLNLTININSCDNPNETAEVVKNELNPILDFLR